MTRRSTNQLYYFSDDPGVAHYGCSWVVNETQEMEKFYRVKKDTFMWEEGAILKYNPSYGGYSAINNLWDVCDLGDEYIGKGIIEKLPEWFERVYEVSTLGKAVYVLKDKAKEMFGRDYKAD